MRPQGIFIEGNQLQAFGNHLVHIPHVLVYADFIGYGGAFGAPGDFGVACPAGFQGKLAFGKFQIFKDFPIDKSHGFTAFLQTFIDSSLGGEGSIIVRNALVGGPGRMFVGTGKHHKQFMISGSPE